MQPTNYQQGAANAIHPLPSTAAHCTVGGLFGCCSTACRRQKASRWQTKFRKSRASFRNSHITTRPAEQLPGSGALHCLQSESNRFCRGVVHSARTDHTSGIWDSLLHALMHAEMPLVRAREASCICAGWLLFSCQDSLVVSLCWAPMVEHHRLAQGH